LEFVEIFLRAIGIIALVLLLLGKARKAIVEVITEVGDLLCDVIIAVHDFREKVKNTLRRKSCS
jgi:hypothetical protein